MTCEKVDDRTPEEVKTHVWGVVARDSFMSHWGGSRGGFSRCAWACSPGADIDKLYSWVTDREEMKYVNIVKIDTYRPSKSTAHYHIYACNSDHNSQK